MRPQLTITEVVDATGADVRSKLRTSEMDGLALSGVSTDTRTLRRGDMFVALRGPRSDGHAFIREAVARGAAAVIASSLEAVAVSSQVPVLLVPDTLRALGAIAGRYRRHLKAKVVGVTGSVGKTTTTALAAQVLAQRYRVLRSEEAWNAEVGVPLTLFSADGQTEVIVVEMAMRGLGQIRELVEIAAPQVGVVTNVGESHLELLGTQERIAQAKGELLAGLPEDGVAVLNADDPWSATLAKVSTAQRIIWYGLRPTAEVRADAVTVIPDGVLFRLTTGSAGTEVRLPLLGRHNVANALAAAAVGHALGVGIEQIRAGLEQAARPHMRLEVEDLGPILILNDAYNASPQSMRAALDVLDQLAERRRKVAVLGDMKELGPQSHVMHSEVGRDAAKRGVALLVAVGPEAKALAEGAQKDRSSRGRRHVVHVPDPDGAVPVLLDLLHPADVVLIKGSRAMGLERIVDALRSHFAIRA